MAIRSGFFNSVGGDRRYQADFFALFFGTLIGNGVFPNPSTGLQVLANQNMTVAIKPGKGWINGYFFVNDSDYNLTIDNADGVLNRIDRVVLQLNFLNRQIIPVIKKGTFASSPVAPALKRDADAYEIALADIYIGKGVLSISQANITDLRLNTSLCGIVKGVVDQVDTTTIFNQYQSWYQSFTANKQAEIAGWQTAQEQEFDNWQAQEKSDFDTWKEQEQADFDVWFQSIQDVLSGDVAANLSNRISTLEQSFNAHKAEYATQSKSGHMSAADKSKLDGIQSGAQTNQNAFSNVKVGATTIAADNATDTLELVAGLNIALTPDATNDKVTISTNAEVNQNAFSNIKIGTSTISANSKTDTLEFAPGNGIALSSDTTNDKVTISANFAGTGSAPTVSRSDHNHDTTYAKISDAQMVKLTQDDGSSQTIPDNTDITTFGGTGFFIGKNLVGMPNNDQSVYRFIINPSGPTTRTIIAVRSGNETYIASVNSGVWSGWEKVLTDKAASWVTLSLQNGIMPYQSGQNLQCCKVGNIVFIRGVMKGITGQAVIATLPAGYRPVSMPHSFSMPSSANRHARYTIGLNGDLSIENMSDNNFNSAYWYPVMTSYIAD